MAVAFDAKATANAHAINVDTTNLDLTGLTIGAGSDRALVATVSILDETGAPSFTLTWDPAGTPQALTLIGSINNGNEYALLYGLVAPASGNKTLRLTTSGTHKEVFLDAASFTGVNQTGGTTSFANVATNTGTSTTISVAVTSAVGYMTIDAVIGPQVISSPTQTSIYADNGGSFTSGAASYADGASTVTHQWTLASSVGWAACGCSIVASVAAAPDPKWASRPYLRPRPFAPGGAR